MANTGNNSSISTSIAASTADCCKIGRQLKTITFTSEDYFRFAITVSRELGLRDIRSLAILIVLLDDTMRSVRELPGVSVQFLADKLGEAPETIRHIMLSLQASGLAVRSGNVQRTYLFQSTPEARRKLGLCFSAFGGRFAQV